MHTPLPARAGWSNHLPGLFLSLTNPCATYASQARLDTADPVQPRYGATQLPTTTGFPDPFLLKNRIVGILLLTG